MGPAGAPSRTECIADRTESSNSAKHDVIATEGEARTGKESPVRGAMGEHEHLAARQQPLLARVRISPNEPHAKEVGEIVRSNILIPLILQRLQLDVARLAGGDKLLGEPWQPLRQQ